MSNLSLIDYDPVSDTLHLELATRQDSASIVHYTDHPHVALLLDEKTRQAVGFHIEAVSEFIRPGIISKFEKLKELARDETLTKGFISVKMILLVRDKTGLAGNFKRKVSLPFAPREGMELYEQIVRLVSWYDGYFICVMEDDNTSKFEWRKDDLLSDGWELVKEFAKNEPLPES
jgi:hypothetical protein